jgi:hypothetical protein
LSATGPDFGHTTVPRSGRSSISCLAADAGNAAAAAAAGGGAVGALALLGAPAAAGTEGRLLLQQQRTRPVVLQATALQLPTSHPLLLSPTSDGGCSDAFRCCSAGGSVRSSVELAAADSSSSQQQQQELQTGQGLAS